MNLKPLFDRVLIKQAENETTTASGIVLPGQSVEKPLLATIIAVGNGGVIDGKTIEIIVKPGDKIVYSKYAGNEFKIGKEEFIIIRQSDILAIVE